MATTYEEKLNKLKLAAVKYAMAKKALKERKGDEGELRSAAADELGQLAMAADDFGGDTALKAIQEEYERTNRFTMSMTRTDRVPHPERPNEQKWPKR